MGALRTTLNIVFFKVSLWIDYVWIRKILKSKHFEMPPLEIDYRAWEDKVIKINLQLKTSRYIQWSNIKDHFFVCSLPRTTRLFNNLSILCHGQCPLDTPNNKKSIEEISDVTFPMDWKWLFFRLQCVTSALREDGIQPEVGFTSYWFLKSKK